LRAVGSETFAGWPRADLLQTNYPKARSVSSRDRVQGEVGAASSRVDPTGPKQRLPIDPLVRPEP
jgi:hypothetical protein